MDPVSVLTSAAKALYDAVQLYNGNELSLKQLAKLVNNTVQLVRSANICDFPEAAEVVDSLTDYINQGQQFVDKVNRKAPLWRVLKMTSLQEKLGIIITGIRDCLAEMTMANFCLSQQQLQALNRVRGDLEVYWGSQQQALAHLVQIQAQLQQLSTGASTQHGMMMEILQTVLDRLDMAPRQLAAEVQQYTRQASSSEGAPSSSELQVGQAKEPGGG
jgi:hypothetical protein